MKISYVTAARMPTEKAHGVSIAHMCAAFAKEGADVELVVPARRNLIEKNLFDFYGVPQSFSFLVVPAPDFVGRGWTHPIFFLLQRMLFVRAVAPILSRDRVIYTREPEIVRAFGKTHKVVYEAHRIPRGIAGWLTGRLLRRATLVVCNSKGTEEAVRALGVTHTLVAPNGFDPELFSGALPSRAELGLSEGPLALYAGSDAPWKGAGVLREAARFVKSASIALVGGAKQGREGALIDVGRVAPERVPAYLRSADILVLPNTAENEESERFTSPIKLFEYLGAGKAIIASNLPSIREVLAPEDALFVPPGDPQALAEAIERLASDKALTARLVARSFARSHEFTWGARAHRVLSSL